MDINQKLSTLSGAILLTWWILHISLEDTVMRFQSHLLFRKWTYNKFDNLYKLMYSKLCDEKDTIYITKLKVRLNTYLSKYKYGNKSSLDSIVTIIISSLITITITQYTIQGQANKELIAEIVKSLNNDFMTIFFIVIEIYGIKGIIQEFVSSKFEYYLMTRNIIDEIEKNKTMQKEDNILQTKKEDLLEIISEENYHKQCNKINQIKTYYKEKKLSHIGLKTQLIILKNEEIKIRESKFMEFITMMVGLFVAYVAALVGLANNSSVEGLTNRLALVLVSTIVPLIIFGSAGFWINNKINNERNNKKNDIDLHKSVVEELLEEVNIKRYNKHKNIRHTVKNNRNF